MSVNEDLKPSELRRMRGHMLNAWTGMMLAALLFLGLSGYALREAGRSAVAPSAIGGLVGLILAIRVRDLRWAHFGNPVTGPPKTVTGYEVRLRETVRQHGGRAGVMILATLPFALLLAGIAVADLPPSRPRPFDVSELLLVGLIFPVFATMGLALSARTYPVWKQLRRLERR